MAVLRPFRRTKVLAVDDEVGFTRILKIAARHYDIRAENDAERALQAAIEFRPDVILMDRFMPKMWGDSLALQFKAHPKLKQTPIIFLTATVPQDDSGQLCTHLHGYPILQKPFSIEDIDRCIEQCLKN